MAPKGFQYVDGKFAHSAWKKQSHNRCFDKLSRVQPQICRGCEDGRGVRMSGKQALLSELHQARLESLKEMCLQNEISRNGPVEVIRARLITELVLDEWDLSAEGLDNIMNNQLGEILAVYGIKKSGSIRERKQRLYLHLNHDPKQLTPEKLDDLSREKLHELCVKLDLPRSGTKQALLLRVAGVLTAQNGSWGVIKKSLRRPRGKVKQIAIPSPDDEPSGNISETYVVEPVYAEEVIEIEEVPTVEIIELPPIEIKEEIIQQTPVVEPKPIESVPDIIEVTESVMEIEGRVAEIDALCREFLLVGSVHDNEDVSAFISSLSDHGISVNDANVNNFVRSRLMELNQIAIAEKESINSLPNSWREREALRRFEEARQVLRESLPEIIANASGDMVKARVAFEDRARGLALDLRLPAVSGRLHALFDLQVSLDEEIAASDPKTARRTRVARVLQHGAIHLTSEQRMNLDRLERNIEGFEQLATTIFERSEGVYGEPQQALLIRFLEKKGYNVNTADLRPRVVAAAGIIGAELGFISPSDIPRIAPGIKVSDTEVESIITDLKRLAQQFKSSDEKNTDEEEELAESVADASDRVSTIKSKIDGVDELLARLKISNN